MTKIAQCPACKRRISINAPDCPKCGDPLGEGWVEKSLADEKAFNGKIYGGCFLVILAPLVLVLIGVMMNSNTGDSGSQYTANTSKSSVSALSKSSSVRKARSSRKIDRLPSRCWRANEPIPSDCIGQVQSNLFPFCPSETLYEQVKDMLPSKTAVYGCETDVEGRRVKVLSCSYKTCKYGLYYGYNKWVTMWSQAGVVVKSGS